MQPFLFIEGICVFTCNTWHVRIEMIVRSVVRERQESFCLHKADALWRKTSWNLVWNLLLCFWSVGFRYFFNSKTYSSNSLTILNHDRKKWCFPFLLRSYNCWKFEVRFPTWKIKSSVKVVVIIFLLAVLSFLRVSWNQLYTQHCRTSKMWIWYYVVCMSKIKQRAFLSTGIAITG